MMLYDGMLRKYGASCKRDSLGACCLHVMGYVFGLAVEVAPLEFRVCFSIHSLWGEFSAAGAFAVSQYMSGGGPPGAARLAAG
jgi:hypothetical protein